MAVDPIGPYRVNRTLGRGGNAVVYEVVGDDGTPAALKWWTAGDADAFRREVRLQAGLRHEGVVRVLDQGEHAGRPYAVLELVSGGTFADHLAARRLSMVGTLGFDDDAEAPADVEPALRTLLDLCMPLAWLHGEGLVHADLKPANVLLREGGEVVIADLGLTRAVSRRARVEDRVRGSLGYVSPEQARGDGVDARADLYSLGAMLHEVLTGRPPVDPANPRHALRRLQDEDGPAPSASVDVDPALDALVVELLRRDPRRRPPSALAVARVLAGVLGVPAPRDRRVRPSLFLPVLSGRAVELDHADAAVGRAQRDGGGLVVIRGDSGLGATRLAAEVATRARARGEALVAVRAGNPAPLSTIRALAERLAELGRRPPPYAVTTSAAADALVAELGALGRPALIVIDDLDNADPASVEALGHALGGLLLRPASAAFLATATGAATPALDALFGVAAQVALGPLAPDECLAIASGMLGAPGPLPRSFAEALRARADGSPLRTREWVHTAVASGALRMSADGWEPATDPGTPPTLDALLDARLDGVTDAAARAALGAAVLGDGLTEARLDRWSPDAAAQQGLVAARLLERDDDGVRLVHPRVAGRIRRRVGDAVWAAASGEVLDAFGAESPLDLRARWATDAGRTSEAAAAWAAVGDRDCHVAGSGAAEAWHHAWRLTTDPAVAARAAVWAATAGHLPCLRWAAAALAGARPADAAVAEAALAELEGRYDDAVAWAERAERAGAGDRARALRFHALRRRGATAAELRAAFPDHATEADGRIAAALAFHEGDWATAADAFRRVAAAAERQGEVNDHVRALGNVAACELRAGYVTAAMPPLVASLIGARHSGAWDTEVQRWLTLAQVAQLDGDIEAAIARASTGLALAIERGHRSSACSLLSAITECGTADAVVAAEAAEALGDAGWVLGWALARAGRFDDAQRVAAVGPGIAAGLAQDEVALASLALGTTEHALGRDVFHLRTGRGRDEAIAAWRAIPLTPGATYALACLGVPHAPTLPPLPPLLAGALTSRTPRELAALARRRFR